MNSIKVAFSAIDCGTLLNIRPQPKQLLFHFNPSIYKWFERIEKTRETEQWLVAQHAKLIRIADLADLVAIWSSGHKAGVYAFGQIITKPAKKPLSTAQEKYFVNKDDRGKVPEKDSVWVDYSKVFIEKPLLQEECKDDKVLLDMQIFINSRGTKFRVTPQQ